MSLWDHLPPQELHHVPRGLCTCDALSWSYGHPRPHNPATCAKWRAIVVAPEKADELRAWFEEEAE